MTTWAIYIRVSRADAARRASMSFVSPRQQEDLVRSAIIGEAGPVFQDIDVSGSTFVRDGLDRALRWIAQDSAQRGLAAYDYSRVGRKTIEFLQLIERLEEQGSKVFSALEKIDTSTPEGRQMLRNFASANEYYRDVSARRWQMVLDGRIAEGLTPGGQTRWGYRRVEGERTQQVDPVAGPLLRDAYLRYTAGTGWGLLVKDLNDAGHRTLKDGDWSTHTLRRALDSGFGAGKIVVHKKDAEDEHLPGAHEAVISEDEWLAYRRARGHRSKLPKKSQNARWFLAGIATCGRCGGPVYVTSYTAAHSYVGCARYRNTRACPGGASMNRATLEKVVAMWIGGHVEEVGGAVDTSTRDGESAAVRLDLERLLEERTQIDARLVRLATGYATGLLDDVGYTGAQAAVLTQRDDLDGRVAELRDRLDALAPVGDDAYERLASMDGEDVGAWNGLLRRVLQRVEVHKDRVVIVPVVGEPREIIKPTDHAKRGHLARDSSGKWVKITATVS